MIVLNTNVPSIKNPSIIPTLINKQRKLKEDPKGTAPWLNNFPSNLSNTSTPYIKQAIVRMIRRINWETLIPINLFIFFLLYLPDPEKTIHFLIPLIHLYLFYNREIFLTLIKRQITHSYFLYRCPFQWFHAMN